MYYNSCQVDEAMDCGLPTGPPKSTLTAWFYGVYLCTLLYVCSSNSLKWFTRGGVTRHIQVVKCAVRCRHSRRDVGHHCTGG